MPKIEYKPRGFFERIFRAGGIALLAFIIGGAFMDGAEIIGVIIWGVGGYFAFKYLFRRY